MRSNCRVPISVGFSILHYAKLRLLELFFKFFDKLFDIIKFEELEMEQTQFTWHLLKKICTNLSNQKKETFGKKCEKMIAETLKRQMKILTSSLERVAVSIKSIMNGSWDFSKRHLDVQKCYVCVARHIAAMTTSPISSNLAVKD